LAGHLEMGIKMGLACYMCPPPRQCPCLGN
jgi:hypothetical protein